MVVVVVVGRGGLRGVSAPSLTTPKVKSYVVFFCFF